MNLMNTIGEIEDAIRALPQKERQKLVDVLPAILPELNGQAHGGEIFYQSASGSDWRQNRRSFDSNLSRVLDRMVGKHAGA